MDLKPRKHNTPVATLLKNYENKKSGKSLTFGKKINGIFPVRNGKTKIIQ